MHSTDEAKGRAADAGRADADGMCAPHRLIGAECAPVKQTRTGWPKTVSRDRRESDNDNGKLYRYLRVPT